MRVNAGGKYRNGFNIEEDEFQVENGIDFFEKYLFPHPDQVNDHFELKSIALVGGPGTGKSTKIRFIVDFIRETWGAENVNAMETDNIQLGIEALNDRLVQLIVVDDAISKQDSRRSMGDENVTATQQFMMIRHEAKKRYTGGVVYVIFAFQDPTAIDKRFRSTCDLVLYSAYYMNEGLEKAIKSKEAITFLRKITREQKYNNFEYRAYAVGHTSWGDIVNVKVPYVPEAGFNIKRIESTGRKEELKLGLIDRIIAIDLIDEDNAVIYGFLTELRNNTPELQLYNFNQGDFKEIAWRAKAKIALGGGKSRVKRHFGNLIRYVRESLDLSYAELESETGIPKTILNRFANKGQEEDQEGQDGE